MTRLAPLVERTDDSSHQYSCWIEPTSRTTSRPRSGGSRRRPALPLGKSPLPFQRKTTFWSRLIAASASSTSPRAGPGRPADGPRGPRVAVAFIAVKEVGPMWPVVSRRCADVIALGRHNALGLICTSVSLRVPDRVSAWPRHCRVPMMSSGRRRWPSRRWVLSTPMHLREPMQVQWRPASRVNTASRVLQAIAGKPC